MRAAASATLAPASVVSTERLMMSPTARARVGGVAMPSMLSVLRRRSVLGERSAPAALTGAPAGPYDPFMTPLDPVTLPTMYRVRQSFTRTRLEDIPGGVAPVSYT